MATQFSNQNGPSLWIDNQAPRVRDAGGYEIFSHGNTGRAHAFAHRMFDSGQIQTGRRGLIDWFAGKQGHGSEWLHLHFHLALFELETGAWQRAHARFMTEMLPAATSSADALTDAPGLLWRLEITAPEQVALPWQPLRRTALANLHGSHKPFVQLHNLLALAGAGDVFGIQQWYESGSEDKRKLLQFVPALKALAARSWGQAGVLLHGMAREISSIDGSRAQNRLFEDLAAWCTQRNLTASSSLEQRYAA